jgi:hypothetical protein
MLNRTNKVPGFSKKKVIRFDPSGEGEKVHILGPRGSKSDFLVIKSGCVEGNCCIIY